MLKKSNLFPISSSNGLKSQEDQYVVKLFEYILISSPIISLVVMAISWLVYGIDIPYMDDWEALFTGTVGSFSPKYLFEPLNDTIFPTGRVLDALAFRYLNNNSVAYQFLSMTICLGSLLFLQWHLLRSAIKIRAVAVGGFALTIFMMQPGSYWGWQNMGYHQVLPLVFLLAIIALAVRSQVKPIPCALLCFALGLLSGFSYISGPLSTAAAAGVFAVFCFRHRRFVPPLVGLLLSTLITFPMQFWVVIGKNNGHIHTGTAWVLPDTIHFWMYLFGKVARAFSLQGVPIYLAMTVALAVGVFVAFISIRAVSALLRAKHASHEDVNRDIIVTTLAAVVFLYLIAVTSSRAGMIGPDYRTSPYISMFTFGQLAYHFFWVSILIPWMFVWACHLLPRLQGPVALLAGAMCLLLAISLGVGNNPAEFKRVSDYRSVTAIACLQDKLLAAQELFCPRVYPRPLTNFEFGRYQGLSYMRYFPPILQATGEKVRILTANLPADSIKIVLPEFSIINGKEVARSGDSVVIDAQPDANLMVVTTGNERACHHMVIQADITPAITDAAQVFYKPSGTTGYTEENSNMQMLKAGVANAVRLEIFSKDGFEQDLRLDPVSQQQIFKIRGLSYYCDY
jgi:hypothetical protein